MCQSSGRALCSCVLSLTSRLYQLKIWSNTLNQPVDAATLRSIVFSALDLYRFCFSVLVVYM